jgi:hypothetical protein
VCGGGVSKPANITRRLVVTWLRKPRRGALFSDILVVPHALGQRVTFVEGEGPRLDALKDPLAFRTLRAEIVHHLERFRLHRAFLGGAVINEQSGRAARLYWIQG